MPILFKEWEWKGVILFTCISVGFDGRTGVPSSVLSENVTQEEKSIVDQESKIGKEDEQTFLIKINKNG